VRSAGVVGAKGAKTTPRVAYRYIASSISLSSSRTPYRVTQYRVTLHRVTPYRVTPYRVTLLRSLASGVWRLL